MTNRWKNLLASTSIFALLVSFLSFPVFVQAAAGPFPDVDDVHMNVTAIQFMKDSGVFEGYPDGTYQPDRVLNRAEQLKVYMLLHGLDPDADTYKNCFPDVQEEWFARFVCFAKAQSWVEGYPDGTYKPGQDVNKVEALKMLGEIQGWDMTEPTENVFDDAPAGQWYSKYVQFAKDAGLLLEKSGNFHPADGLTRALTAEILYRSLAVYALGETAYTPDLESQILAVDVSQLPPPPSLIINLGNAPTAEYGDAPENGASGYAGSWSVIDAAFPTLYNTTNSVYGPGAHALDSSMEWLGDPNQNDSYSYEDDADDINDPDGTMNLTNDDLFDDGVTGVNIVLTSIPPPATLTVEVTVEDTAPDVPRYLNALIDLNMDGKWKGSAAGGEKEWVVKNYVVNVTPGTTEAVTSDAFAYANGMILTPTAWMRVVLSREPIDAATFGTNGWDGSGAFANGEVEDYFLQLPDWDDGNGGSGGGAGGIGGAGLPGGAGGGRGVVWGKPAPVMICPTKVKFPKGANAVIFSCGVYNLGGRGDVSYDFWRINGAVNVFPTFNILTMPTGPPGFFVAGFPGGNAGVMGNPTREWFVGTNRAGVPSTWMYEIVGIDPPSTVEDSVVDLGIVPGEKDEGYEAEDIWTVDDFAFWSDEVNDTYLVDPEAVGPVIVDAAFFEMDNSSTPGVMRYVGLADVRDSNTPIEALNIEWSSPVGCGEVSTFGARLEWQFPDGDMDECLSNGLELAVDDGENFIVDSFFDVFIDVGLVEPPPVNQLPVINGLTPVWTNTIGDDPHIYTLTLDASDPDGDPLTYSWTSVDCGAFTLGADTQTVTWEYALADMELCGMADVTVEVSDGTATVQDVMPIF